MRALFVVSLIVLLCPVIARAQSQPAPASPPQQSAAPAAKTAPAAKAASKGGDITRDDYIERAKRNAEKRFDRMDSDHDGVLTLDERRAARGKGRASSTSQ